MLAAFVVPWPLFRWWLLRQERNTLSVTGRFERARSRKVHDAVVASYEGRSQDQSHWYTNTRTKNAVKRRKE